MEITKINKRKSILAFGAILALAVLALMLSSCDTLFGDDDDDAGSGSTVSGTPLEANTTVTDSAGNVYEVGYRQVSGNNQNPFVKKTSPGGNESEWVHDTTARDTRGIAIGLGPNDVPFVLFSTDGGDSSSFRAHAAVDNPFDGAPFRSFGSGGGPKVSIVARLDPESGRIEKATYLRAQLSGGNTNSFQPRAIAVVGDKVLVEANSAAWPPAAGATQGSWQQYDPDAFNNETRADGNDLFRVTLPLDLSELSNVQWLDNR